MKHRDQTTTVQFKDISLRVSTQKFKSAFAKMFCIEFKFVNDCLHKSFETNIKAFHQKTPDLEQHIYEE